MIRRDFDLEEMKYFLNLVELSTDDYLYIFDFTNDRAICSKSITDVFPFESNAFENATAQLKTVVHPDDIDMLMEDLQEGINGRRKEHNLEYRWKTVDGTYVAINCRGQYVISHGIKYLIGRISEIGKQSRFDNNTGLYREVVLENVYNEYCKVRHSRGFLMLVGVDNFKELNEKYGAKTGDEVLNILTDAIRRYIDTQLRIFRMPGDECAIFMPYTIEDNIVQAKNLYKRIRNRIDRVIEHRKYDIFFTISAGAAEFDTERDSFNDLLKNAKFSLHAAKLNGKNRCEIFDSVNYMEYIKKLGIQDELRRCISEGFEGFELYFQPIYNPQNDKLSGAEALIRWNCSKYGFMEPDKFIPLLEESALIIPLGRWIIDTAAKACNRWITNIPDFVMHINLSFVQIVKSNIIKDVLERIGRYSAANNHYVFEITETIEMDRIPAVERVFKEFIKNDFRLAIDDFGTGYSNYGYMRDKIFDIVKVDRSFITDIDKQRNNYLMVSFIIKMAHEMGLHVCIEGVETKEELACVRELGADYIQGYYYGKPVCVADFEEQHLKKLILG